MVDNNNNYINNSNLVIIPINIDENMPLIEFLERKTTQTSGPIFYHQEII